MNGENNAPTNTITYESAKQEILSYYFKSFKNTQEIIIRIELFFDSLTELKQVYILGHSISPVDLKYFQVLKREVKR